MRILNALLAGTFLITACGGGEEEAYDTFADCYVDHSIEEALPPDEAIAVCCLEHPIDGETNVVCGESAQECVDFVDAEVTPDDDPDLTLDDIEAGCDVYIAEH